MSHVLPDPIRVQLGHLICSVEERLQSEVHCVHSAIQEHPSFDEKFVESPLVRAIIRSAVNVEHADGLQVENFPNGGVGLVNDFELTQRRFRFRHAKRDRRGRLVVRTSSDSVLTTASDEPSLFDSDVEPAVTPEAFEQWIVAYLLYPGTLTFMEVSAGRVVGRSGQRPPYRLLLENLVRIPHTAPLPPDFSPKKDEDLDLEDGEDRDEEAG